MLPYSLTLPFATWCEANKLAINVSNTNYMLFENRGRKVSTYETVLSLVNTTSFIGLNIDVKLNWGKHINDVCNVLKKDGNSLWNKTYCIEKYIGYVIQYLHFTVY